MQESRWKSAEGHILSIGHVRGAETIDDGNTVVVAVTTSEGARVSLLVPKRAALVLIADLLRAVPDARDDAPGP